LSAQPLRFCAHRRNCRPGGSCKVQEKQALSARVYRSCNRCTPPDRPSSSVQIQLRPEWKPTTEKRIPVAWAEILFDMTSLRKVTGGVVVGVISPLHSKCPEQGF